MNAIEINGLRYAYGKTPILHDLRLAVPAGSIYGFLGRNGAGKSTCIQILAGLRERQQGEVRVLGADPAAGSAATFAEIGYVAESGILPSQMRVGALLDWTRALYARWDAELIERWTAKFRLDRRKRVHELSLGQQRQLAFLLAVAPRPRLMILDEPAANLDTVARRAFLEEIAALAREEEATVFFSTHVLSDVERVADHVGILAEGRLLVDEPLDALKETVRQVRFHWDRPESPPVEPPGAFRSRRARGETLVTMRVAEEAVLAELAGKAGCRWEVRGLNLEDLFVELTQEESH